MTPPNLLNAKSIPYPPLPTRTSGSELVIVPRSGRAQSLDPTYLMIRITNPGAVSELVVSDGF